MANLPRRSFASRSRPRDGFTLLEVMVALTITMILMSLVVRIFQFVSDGVFAARANMELSDALRNAKHRLIADLRGTTALTLPPLDIDQGTGYFEYAEGPFAAGAGPDVGFRPTGTLGGVSTAPLYFTEYGDRDDILMFTSLSLDEHFKGRTGSQRPFIGKDARFAEIAWFPRIQQEFANAEARALTLRRRAWLISRGDGDGQQPQTVDVSSYISGGTGSGIPAPPTARQSSSYFNPSVIAGGPPTLSGSVLLGNSMDTIGWRQNRVFHNHRLPPYALFTFTQGLLTSLTSPASMDFITWTMPISSDTYNLSVDTLTTGTPTPATGGPGSGASYGAELRDETTTTASSRASREQDDIVLTNVVGFDVKAWDPGAPVFRTVPDPLSPNVVSVLLPGDAGYVAAVERFINSPTAPANQPVSFGAYADLNYFGYQSRITGTITGSSSPTARYLTALNSYRNSLSTGVFPSRIPSPSFSGPGNPLSRMMPTFTGTTADTRVWTRPCTYDTWCSGYEYDGLDGNFQTNTGLTPFIRPFYQRIDEGSNLIDDVTEVANLPAAPTTLTGDNPFFNGLVDDVTERDAPPPYEAPLRGLRISIRVMEPDSKQVREATVVHEFLPL